MDSIVGRMVVLQKTLLVFELFVIYEVVVVRVREVPFYNLISFDLLS
jgi:hypothetical protein